MDARNIVSYLDQHTPVWTKQFMMHDISCWLEQLMYQQKNSSIDK